MFPNFVLQERSAPSFVLAKLLGFGGPVDFVNVMTATMNAGSSLQHGIEAWGLIVEQVAR